MRALINKYVVRVELVKRKIGETADMESIEVPFKRRGAARESGGGSSGTLEKPEKMEFSGQRTTSVRLFWPTAYKPPARGRAAGKCEAFRPRPPRVSERVKITKVEPHVIPRARAVRRGTLNRRQEETEGGWREDPADEEIATGTHSAEFTRAAPRRWLRAKRINKEMSP
jgi:hypothetical protein